MYKFSCFDTNLKLDVPNSLHYKWFIQFGTLAGERRANDIVGSFADLIADPQSPATPASKSPAADESLAQSSSRRKQKPLRSQAVGYKSMA